MKKIILTTVASCSLLLAACQNKEDEVTQVVEETPEVNEQEIVESKEVNQEVLKVSAENSFTEYQWKTNYTFVLQDYLHAYGFMDEEVDPFAEYSPGIASVKLIQNEDREIPYLAILYAYGHGSLSIPSVKNEEWDLLDQDIGVYIDIWDIENNDPVRILHKKHAEGGLVGDLAVAIVETEQNEVLVREATSYRSSYIEVFYKIPDMDNPIYRLDSDFYGDSETSEESEQYLFNDQELTKEQYEEKSRQLNRTVTQWIESEAGYKYLSDNLKPIIPNVLSVFDELDTSNIPLQKEILQSEVDSMVNKIILVSDFGSFSTNTEKIIDLDTRGIINGAVVTDDYSTRSYYKEIIDFYSQSYFNFILNPNDFLNTFEDVGISYENGRYDFIAADFPGSIVTYLIDVNDVEKINEEFYLVEFTEYDFDIISYESDGLAPENYWENFSPYRSDWPEDAEPYMLNVKTSYALYKKNKYGLALLDKSDAPIDYTEY